MRCTLTLNNEHDTYVESINMPNKVITRKVANTNLAVVESTERPDFLLASTSWRRVELLRQIGAHFEQVRVFSPEKRNDGESPEEFVLRVSIEKAVAGWERKGAQARLPVMGADTIVLLGGDVLGKPRDREHGLAMLKQLSGQTHEVLTGVALVDEDRRLTAMSRTRVDFCEIDDDMASAYWETAEPVDKAGGFAIQGRGAMFVKAIEGSYSGVVGLPLFETAELLKRFSIPLFD